MHPQLTTELTQGKDGRMTLRAILKTGPSQANAPRRELMNWSFTLIQITHRCYIELPDQRISAGIMPLNHECARFEP